LRLERPILPDQLKGLVLKAEILDDRGDYFRNLRRLWKYVASRASAPTGVGNRQTPVYFEEEREDRSM